MNKRDAHCCGSSLYLISYNSVTEKGRYFKSFNLQTVEGYWTRGMHIILLASVRVYVRVYVLNIRLISEYRSSFVIVSVVPGLISYCGQDICFVFLCVFCVLL